MVKLLSVAVLITAFFVWGCGSTEKNTEIPEASTNGEIELQESFQEDTLNYSDQTMFDSNLDSSGSWKFELQDSIQFDFLGNPVLSDVEFGKILIYDELGREFILLDQESGKLINKFSKKGDRLDYFGYQSILPGFLDENRIAIAGLLGIFVFSPEGKLLRKLAHPEPQSGSAFISMPGKSIQWIDFQNKRHILFKSLRTHESFQGEKKFYTRFRAIEITDPETGDSQEFIPFRQGSRFLNGLGWEMPDYEPVFTSDSEDIFIAFATEPKIHKYEISGDSLVWKQSQNLDLINFGEISGKPLKSFEEITFSSNILQAAIWKIAVWKDKLLVYYYSGLSTKEMEETDLLYEQGRNEEAMAIAKKRDKGKSSNLLILEKSTLLPITHISLPHNVNRRGFALDGDNFFFQKAGNPDLEEDFIRLYRYKLIEK